MTPIQEAVLSNFVSSEFSSDIPFQAALTLLDTGREAILQVCEPYDDWDMDDLANHIEWIVYAVNKTQGVNDV